jgi:hypothetical protein
LVGLKSGVDDPELADVKHAAALPPPLPRIPPGAAVEVGASEPYSSGGPFLEAPFHYPYPIIHYRPLHAPPLSAFSLCVCICDLRWLGCAAAGATSTTA